MKKALLEVKGVSYTYGRTIPALHEVNITFFAQERVVVVGANGSGKSTLFLNMNGILDPDKGSIFFKGAAIGKKEKLVLRKSVGFVFQEAEHQLVAPTVEMEVSFGPMNLKLDREEVRARTASSIAEMDLTELSGRTPHSLSGGEKKRVSIAGVLAMEPEIILLDEPMLALDPENQKMLKVVLEKLHGQGKTLIVSTHDMDFAYEFADRVLVMANGRVIGDGTPDEIFSNETIMRQAHLAPPRMMNITMLLRKHGILPDSQKLPRTIEALEAELEIKWDRRK